MLGETNFPERLTERFSASLTGGVRIDAARSIVSASSAERRPSINLETVGDL